MGTDDQDYLALGQAFANIGVSCSQLSAAFSKLGEASRRAAIEAKQQRAELWRGNWWQRGEPEPGYIAQVGEPEWWQDCDEPPEFGMAA